MANVRIGQMEMIGQFASSLLFQVLNGIIRLPLARKEMRGCSDQFQKEQKINSSKVLVWEILIAVFNDSLHPRYHYLSLTIIHFSGA